RPLRCGPHTERARNHVLASCAAPKGQLPRPLSPGFASFKGRDETPEGIDRRLALHYYSRWKFIYDLLPLLRKAKDAGEDAKVMLVLSAGIGMSVDVHNLGLKKKYLLGNPPVASSSYTDLAMQSFAEQHPDIAFIHSNPGAVRTQLLANSCFASGAVG
ncbi:hypothetical protein C8T65DRAFT_762537, partial [Cerioporus squamosus]